MLPSFYLRPRIAYKAFRRALTVIEECLRKQQALAKGFEAREILAL
jgi:hypothetical protein